MQLPLSDFTSTQLGYKNWFIARFRKRMPMAREVVFPTAHTETSYKRLLSHLHASITTENAAGLNQASTSSPYGFQTHYATGQCIYGHPQRKQHHTQPINHFQWYGHTAQTNHKHARHFHTNRKYSCWNCLVEAKITSWTDVQFPKTFPQSFPVGKINGKKYPVKQGNALKMVLFEPT